MRRELSPLHLHPTGSHQLHRVSARGELHTEPLHHRDQSGQVNEMMAERRNGREQLSSENSSAESGRVSFIGTLALKVPNATSFVNDNSSDAVIEGMAQACGIASWDIVLDDYYEDDEEAENASNVTLLIESASGSFRSGSRMLFIFNISVVNAQADPVKTTLRTASTSASDKTAIEDRINDVLDMYVPKVQVEVMDVWLDEDTSTPTTTLAPLLATTTVSTPAIDLATLGGFIELRMPDPEAWAKKPKAILSVRQAIASIAKIGVWQVQCDNSSANFVLADVVRFDFNLTVIPENLQTVSDACDDATENNNEQLETTLQMMLIDAGLSSSCYVATFKVEDVAPILEHVTKANLTGSILLQVEKGTEVAGNLAVQHQIKSDLEEMSGVGLQGDFRIALQRAPSLLQLAKQKDLLELRGENDTTIVNVSFECSVPSNVEGGAQNVLTKIKNLNRTELGRRLNETFEMEGLGTVRIVQIEVQIKGFNPPLTWKNKHPKVPHRHNFEVNEAHGLNMSDFVELVGVVNFTSRRADLWKNNPHTTLAVTMALAHLCKVPVSEIQGRVLPGDFDPGPAVHHGGAAASHHHLLMETSPGALPGSFAYSQALRELTPPGGDQGLQAGNPNGDPELDEPPSSESVHNGGATPAPSISEDPNIKHPGDEGYQYDTSNRDLPWTYEFVIENPKMFLDETLTLLYSVNSTGMEALFDECLGYVGLSPLDFHMKGLEVHQHALPLHPMHPVVHHPVETVDEEADNMTAAQEAHNLPEVSPEEAQAEGLTPGQDEPEDVNPNDPAWISSQHDF